MFSEYEVAVLIEIPEVAEQIKPLKKEFIANEASLLEISDHDFLSLVLLSPSLGLALANGSISLFEELALNRMARAMSYGGFYLKVDPVVYAMKFLIKSFEKWEDTFYAVIRRVMESSLDLKAMKEVEIVETGDSKKTFARAMLFVPHIFVHFLSGLVLSEDLFAPGTRRILPAEYDKLKEIGGRLNLAELPVFDTFLDTFDVN